MKRINKYTIILLAIIMLFSTSIKGAKVGPLIRAFYEQQINANNESDKISLDSNNSTTFTIEYLSNLIPISVEKDVATTYAFIETNNNFNRFDEYNINYNSKFDNIYTARLTAEQIELLALDQDVIRIEASAPYKLDLDVSLDSMYVSLADSTFGYRGKGVIIGIIDENFDLWNPDFQNTNDTTTRILYYFDAGDDTGPSPFDYGTEYTDAEINNRTAGHLTSGGHGTAVTGIAAGNGKRSKNGVASGTYRGVAPESNIIIFDLSMLPTSLKSSANIIDGVNYIKSKADSLNMPCVINISSGSDKGPRDGTSPFETALSYAGFDLGTAIVTSAGNSNYVAAKPRWRGMQWHAIRNSSGTPSSQDTVEFYVGCNNNAFDFEYVSIQIWYPEGEEFYVGLISPSGDGGAKFGPNNGNASPGHGIPRSSGFVAIHNEDYDFTHLDPYPDTYGEITIDIADYFELGIPLEEGTWKITMDSGQGRWDTYIWACNSQDSTIIFNYTNEGTVNEPGNAYNIITVGSFTSKNEWIDVDSNQIQAPDYIIGDTSYFSSQGPTRDGRIKPDILAPGAVIASSVSDFYIQYTLNFNSTLLAYDSCHYHRDGTSFSSPHIAGLVALMLQIDPTLIVVEIIDCLESTAIDGKVDAYNALLCVGAQFCQGECGDANGDNNVSISDAVYMINYLFSGGNPPSPVVACGDANGDTKSNVSDVVFLINYVFSGGNPPGNCTPGEWDSYGGNCCPFYY